MPSEGRLKHASSNTSAVRAREHGHQPDVNDLSGLITHHVHAQQLHVLAAEEEFQEPVQRRR